MFCINETIKKHLIKNLNFHHNSKLMLVHTTNRLCHLGLVACIAYCILRVSKKNCSLLDSNQTLTLFLCSYCIETLRAGGKASASELLTGYRRASSKVGRFFGHPFVYRTCTVDLVTGE